MENDPFSLLGLEREFDVDASRIEAAYRRRVASIHPDRRGEALDQAEAAAETARLNEARMTLLDDERRANALLVLLGGATREQGKSLPDGFLMEIMEHRESMEQVLAGGDAQKRDEVLKWATTERDRYCRTVADLFRSAIDTGDAAPLAAIRRELNAWRYIERMIEQLDPEHEPLM